MEMTLNEEIEYLQSGNWYDKVQAVLPTDEYLKLGWAIGDILETLELFRSLAPEPQTNADRIRAMSNKELAVFLERVHVDPCSACCDNLYWCRRNNAPEPVCQKHFFKWLQQLAEEDT